MVAGFHAIGELLRGIEARGLSDQVNVVIVSDHGMARLSREKMIVLSDYIKLDYVVLSEINPNLALSARDGGPLSADALYTRLARAAYESQRRRRPRR